MNKFEFNTNIEEIINFVEKGCIPNLDKICLILKCKTIDFIDNEEITNKMDYNLFCTIYINIDEFKNITIKEYNKFIDKYETNYCIVTNITLNIYILTDNQILYNKHKQDLENIYYSKFSYIQRFKI